MNETSKSLDTQNKIGLILSHVFVRKEEMYKWEWIENSINNNRKICDFFIILSGHGEPIPSSIKQKIDDYYWISDIKEREIGRGHPIFCIEGYKRCIENGCEYTLKNRAFDWIEGKKALLNPRTFCSTNTNFSKNQLGDLLIFGQTNEMLNLWSCLAWDYNLVDGLENLYKNMVYLWGVEDFSKKTTFLSSQELEWKTINDFKGNGPKYWGI